MLKRIIFISLLFITFSTGAFAYLSNSKEENYYVLLNAPDFRCVTVGSTSNVTLTWIQVSDPSSIFVSYNIYHASSANGPYTQIASINSITQTNYTHASANPNGTDNFYYIVTQSGPNAATDVSPSSDTLQAVLNTPTIEYITIDQPSHLAHIYWTAISSPNIEGYVIYKNVGGIWVSVGTVKGKSSNSFTNNTSTANFVSEKYTVAAYDSIHCPKISPMSEFHKTIYLQNTLDICNAENRLSWNKYIHASPAINEYKVYCSDNGAAYNVLASLTASDSNYVHTNILSGHTYCYYIEALNGQPGIMSHSNIVCATPHMPSKANYCYMRYATVSGPNAIDIAFFVDTSAYNQNFRFYKSEDDGITYTLAYTIPASQNPLMFYYDHIVNTKAQSYTYKVSIVDSCGNETVLSNIGKSILLSGTSSRDMTNTLTWSAYDNWDKGIDNYAIYRKIGTSGSYTYLGQTTASNLSYIDDISTIKEGDGNFCYYIEAVEADGNQYKFKETSKSNEICVQQFPKLFVPNAFIYGGISKVFKPITLFVSFEKYTFYIYNRIGELVFESTDPELGWDGNFNGHKCPDGVYVYSVEYINQNGLLVQRRGTVTLIE